MKSVFESSSIYLRTQSDKNVQYFAMDMDFRQWIPSSMNLTLCYDLPTRTNNTATLDASCNVPVYEYTLKAKIRSRSARSIMSQSGCG